MTFSSLPSRSSFARTHSQLFAQVCEEARTGDPWYLFACCGVNLTVRVASLPRQLLDPLFETVRRQQQEEQEVEELLLLEAFHRLYVRVFCAFHEHWRSCGAKSVMEFEQRIAQFFQGDEVAQLVREEAQEQQQQQQQEEEQVFVMS